MMDRFREGLNGWLAWVFLVIIIVPFIFGGISNFLVSSDSNAVASVDGKAITRPEFEQYYQNMRNRLGENFSKVYDTEEKEREFRNNVVDLLVTQEALTQSFGELKLRVSEPRVRKEIQSFPAFQENGKYSAAVAERRMLEAGYSKERLRGQLEQDLLAKQFSAGLLDTGFVLPYEQEQFIVLDNEQRSGRFVRVPAVSFRSDAAPEDVLVQAWYDSHREQFAVPEKFVLQYIELKREALAAQVSVSEADAQAFYDEHVGEYQSAEKRQFGHILLGVDKAASADDEAKVRVQAEALAERLNKGESFAALAAQYSQDTATKDKGGELDLLEKGVMEPAFDSAGFALTMEKPYSAPVRTAFGYELIRLLTIESGTTLPFADVRGDIVTRLQADKTADLFAEKQQQMTDKGFEVSDSLDEAAKAVELTVQESAEFSRDQPAPIAQLPGVIDAVLGDEVLQERRNSSVLSVGDGHALMLRVKTYTAATTKPLAEMRPVVVAALQEEAARKAAMVWGNTVLAKVRANEEVGALLAEKGLNWEGFEQVTRNSPAPDAMVRSQLFKLSKPAADKPSRHGVALSNGDFLIAEVNALKAADLAQFDEAKRDSYRSRLTRYEGEVDYRSVVKAQKTQRKIERFDSSAPKDGG